MAPAYSLAAVLAGMVAATGSKTPALFVIGSVPMMLTALAFRELARETPDCGTSFTWVTRAFGPWPGWLAGWCSLIAAIVAAGNGAQVAAIYLLEALHLRTAANSMAVQILVGGLAIALLTLLCVRGIDVTERTQAVLVAAQFAMLALVSVVALTKVFSHHAGPQAVMPQWSWLAPAGLSTSAIAHGTILSVFAYWGWDACLSVAEETRNPRTNPGKAAVLATVLVMGTYVTVSYAIQAFAGFGTTGIGLNNPHNANDILSVLGDPVVGGALAVVLLLAISSSALASTLTSLAPTARNMLAMAIYRALPQRLARVHHRYRTPWLATLLIGVGGFGIYLVMTLLSRDSLADMVASLGLMTAFYYAMTAYACVWTYRHTLLRSARDFCLRGGLPLLGALGMTWAFVQSAVDTYAPGYGKTHFGPVGGVFALGMGLLVLGVPVAVLTASASGRDFFRGTTLNAANEIGIPDAPEAL